MGQLDSQELAQPGTPDRPPKAVLAYAGVSLHILLAILGQVSSR